MIVHLTPNEMAGLEWLAKGRCLPKRGRVHEGKFSAKGDVRVHLEGLMGEYAVAKALNVPIDISLHLGGDDKRDLRLADGRSVQIKYRQRRGWDYALTSTDPEEFVADLGILCWGVRGGVEVHGYITRETFLRVAIMKNYGYGPRLVAEPHHFRPLEGLQGHALAGGVGPAGGELPPRQRVVLHRQGQEDAEARTTPARRHIMTYLDDSIEALQGDERGVEVHFTITPGLRELLRTPAGALCWTTAIAQAHDYFVSGQNPDTYEPDLEAE